MTIKLVLKPSQILALSFTFFGGLAMASDQWAMNQANPSHTGYIPVTINPSDIKFRWKKNVSSSALSAVTVAHNQIYVSTPGYFNAQYLYALSKSGTLNWAKSFSGIHSVNPPSYANGKVYMQTVNNSGDTYLRAYDAKSGNILFQSLHGAQWERYLSPTIYKDSVYVNGGSYGGMYSFNAAKNQQNWFFDGLPQVDGWTPAVDEKLAYAYIGGLYAVDRISGKYVFNVANSGDQPQVPMLGGQNDVFVTDGGQLNKFKTDKPKIAWQKIYDFNEGFTGQAALTNGVIYSGTTKGSLVALDQSSGKVLWAWKNPAKESVINNVVATKSHVFFATYNKIYAVDIKTHQNVWSYAVSGQLALGESGLYVAGKGGNLFAFKLGLADIFAPSSVSFPVTTVNAARVKKINITNVGDKDLAISSIESNDSAFSLISPKSFVIKPYHTKTLEVNFKPSSVGTIGTDLVVKSDDQSEPETRIHLEGRGVN